MSLDVAYLANIGIQRNAQRQPFLRRITAQRTATERGLAGRPAEQRQGAVGKGEARLAVHFQSLAGFAAHDQDVAIALVAGEGIDHVEGASQARVGEVEDMGAIRAEDLCNGWPIFGAMMSRFSIRWSGDRARPTIRSISSGDRRLVQGSRTAGSKRCISISSPWARGRSPPSGPSDTHRMGQVHPHSLNQHARSSGRLS